MMNKIFKNGAILLASVVMIFMTISSVTADTYADNIYPEPGSIGINTDTELNLTVHGSAPIDVTFYYPYNNSKKIVHNVSESVVGDNETVHVGCVVAPNIAVENNLAWVIGHFGVAGLVGGLYNLTDMSVTKSAVQILTEGYHASQIVNLSNDTNPNWYIFAALYPTNGLYGWNCSANFVDISTGCFGNKISISNATSTPPTPYIYENAYDDIWLTYGSTTEVFRMRFNRTSQTWSEAESLVNTTHDGNWQTVSRVDNYYIITYGSGVAGGTMYYINSSDGITWSNEIAMVGINMSGVSYSGRGKFLEKDGELIFAAMGASDGTAGLNMFFAGSDINNLTYRSNMSFAGRTVSYGDLYNGSDEYFYASDGMRNLNDTSGVGYNSSRVVLTKMSYNWQNMLGKVEDLSSSSIASIQWGGLNVNTLYQWYANLSDVNGENQTETFNFTTKECNTNPDCAFYEYCDVGSCTANSSYSTWKNVSVNCSRVTTNAVMFLKYTINGYMQEFYVKCADDLRLFYNNYTTYEFADAGRIVPYVVRIGDKPSNNISGVFDGNYQQVIMFNDSTANSVIESGLGSFTANTDLTLVTNTSQCFGSTCYSGNMSLQSTDYVGADMIPRAIEYCFYLDSLHAGTFINHNQWGQYNGVWGYMSADGSVSWLGGDTGCPVVTSSYKMDIGKHCLTETHTGSQQLVYIDGVPVINQTGCSYGSNTYTNTVFAHRSETYEPIPNYLNVTMSFYSLSDEIMSPEYVNESYQNKMGVEGFGTFVTDVTECSIDSDCALCEKCDEGSCIMQTVGEDIKDECVSSFDTCANLYTLQGPNGFCDGAGACDTDSGFANVSQGNVCNAGVDEDPSESIHCAIWGYCYFGATSADLSYVGYSGDGTATCDATGAVDSTADQTASVGYVFDVLGYPHDNGWSGLDNWPSVMSYDVNCSEIKNDTCPRNTVGEVTLNNSCIVYNNTAMSADSSLDCAGYTMTIAYDNAYSGLGAFTMENNTHIDNCVIESSKSYVDTGLINYSALENPELYDGIVWSDNSVFQAQSFTLSQDSYVSAIELYVLSASYSASGDSSRFYTIETDDSDKPSGTLVDAAANVTMSSPTLNQDAWNTFTFSSPVLLSANTTYWIVIKNNEAPEAATKRILYGGCQPGVVCSSMGDVGYPDGVWSYKSGGDDWVSDSGFDLGFRVIGYFGAGSIANYVDYVMAPSSGSSNITVRSSSFTDIRAGQIFGSWGSGLTDCYIEYNNFTNIDGITGSDAVIGVDYANGININYNIFDDISQKDSTSVMAIDIRNGVGNNIIGNEFKNSQPGGAYMIYLTDLNSTVTGNTFDNISGADQGYYEGVFSTYGASYTTMSGNTFKNINYTALFVNAGGYVEATGNTFQDIHNDVLSTDNPSIVINGGVLSGNVFNNTYDVYVFDTGGIVNDNIFYNPWGSCGVDGDATINNNTIYVTQDWESNQSAFGLLGCQVTNNNYIGDLLDYTSSIGRMMLGLPGAGCVGGLIENNTGFDSLRMYGYTRDSDIVVRNNILTNNYTNQYQGGSVAIFYPISAGVSAEIYGNTFNVLGDGTPQIYGMTRYETYALNISMHDNTFNGNAVNIYARPRASGVPVPIFEFYSNIINLTEIMYPIINDSLSSQNYANIHDNTYSRLDRLNIIPYKGTSATATLYPLSFGVVDSGLYNAATEIVMNIQNISTSSLATTWGVSNRVVDGGEFALDGFYVPVNATGNSFSNFVFDVKPADEAGSTYSDNEILYVGAQNGVNDSLVPLEGSSTNSTFSYEYLSYDNESIGTSILYSGGTLSPVCVPDAGTPSGDKTLYVYNCSVPMEYYYPAGVYDLKVDSQDSYGTRNQTNVVEITFGELSAFSQDRTSVTFSGDFVGQANKSIDAPIVVTNMGNKNVTVASILAYDLPGNTVPGYKLGAQYFRAGGTLETSSQLIHGVTVNASLSLPAGPGENASFYLWLSAPSTLYPQGYHSDPSWSMSLN